MRGQAESLGAEQDGYEHELEGRGEVSAPLRHIDV